MSLYMFAKNIFLFFGRFSIIFDIFEPGIWIFIFKGSILLQGEVLEALFRPFITLSFLTGQEIRTSGQEFERPVISFFRTSGQEFERPAEIPNVRPRFWPSGRDSERWRPAFWHFIALFFFPRFPVAHVFNEFNTVSIHMDLGPRAWNHIDIHGIWAQGARSNIESRLINRMVPRILEENMEIIWICWQISYIPRFLTLCDVFSNTLDHQNQFILFL